MATQIKSWQIIDGELKQIKSSLSNEGRKEYSDLEKWLETDPELISPDLMIIGKQIQTRSGPLDLLGIDIDGNLVIIELKRDMLPRNALAQAIDYASDISHWDIERIKDIYEKYSKKDLEDGLTEYFSEISIENLEINIDQRIILIGFSIEASLERMITWLSENFNVNINAIILDYIKTINGEELICKTSLFSEEVEREKIRSKRFKMRMSDEPGDFGDKELRSLLLNYLSQELWSSKRIRRVLFPVCLEKGSISRDQLKQEFVNYGEADNTRDAGYFLSLISQQIGMEKNSFLRQVIEYEYPHHEWEKDNYQIREMYQKMVKEVLNELDEQENEMTN
jgi:hypothetical protein